MRSSVQLEKSADRRTGGPGFVYLIAQGAGSAIKIGSTRDPVSRIKELQTGSSETLLLQRVICFRSRSEATECEKQLHEKFAHYRKCGEWFLSHDDIWVAFAGLGACCGADFECAYDLGKGAR